MPPDGFDLTYQLRPADYRAMMRDFWRLSSLRAWRVRGVRAFFVLIGAGSLAAWWFSGDPVDLVLGAVALCAPWAAPSLNRLYYDRVFAKQRLGEGRQRLTADGDGVLQIGPSGQSRYPWSAVRRVTEPPGQILLWLTPYQAIIVPNRAFTDGAERARFVAFVRERTAGQDF